MGNVIVVLILAIVIAFALRGIYRRKKFGSSCCGGGSTGSCGGNCSCCSKGCGKNK